MNSIRKQRFGKRHHLLLAFLLSWVALLLNVAFVHNKFTTSSTEEVEIITSIMAEKEHQQKEPKELDKREIISRLFGDTTIVSSEMFSTMRKTKQISIVISHCETDLDWIESYITQNRTFSYIITDITIITKCDKEIVGMESLGRLLVDEDEEISIIKLPNVGRCDHSFAYWIENYLDNHQIDKQKDENDLILFLKDNNRHQYDKLVGFDKLFREFQHVFKSTSQPDLGYGGCILKPIPIKDKFDVSVGKPPFRKHPFAPIVFHRRSSVFDKFVMTEYTRSDKDWVGDKPLTFLSNYTGIKEWVDAMGITIPDVKYIPVCYGGMFMVPKIGLLNQPLSTWKNMTKSLSRHDNIVEGHYAERIWLSALTPDATNALQEINNELDEYVTFIDERCLDCRQGLAYVRDTVGSAHKRSLREHSSFAH